MTPLSHGRFKINHTRLALFVGSLQFKASWLVTTFHPFRDGTLGIIIGSGQTFGPCAGLAPHMGHSCRAAPPWKSLSAQTRGSSLSGQGRLTVWRRGAAGRMLLSPVMCLSPGGRNWTIGSKKRKGYSEEGLLPWAPKMARLADYFLVVSYDLDKRGGCLS